MTMTNDDTTRKPAFTHQEIGRLASHVWDAVLPPEFDGAKLWDGSENSCFYVPLAILNDDSDDDVLNHFCSAVDVYTHSQIENNEDCPTCKGSGFHDERHNNYGYVLCPNCLDTFGTRLGFASMTEAMFR